jgi:RND family efflux transporter MFP subunit
MTDLKQDLASLRISDSGSLKSTRRRRWPWVAALAVVLAAVFLWRSAGAAVEVRTVKPAVHTGTNLLAGTPVLTASGYVVARRRAVVSAKIQGRLAELHVEEGARVAEGEVFARLESADFEAAVTRARAQLMQADAQIAGAKALIGSAEAGVTRAAADRAEAERQLQVAERLAKEEILPTDQLDAARSRLKVAEAALGQARAEQQRARADLERATAERARARADVGYNEALLQNTVIRAPFTGTVVRKMAEVGESVAPIPPGVNISTASGAIVALADLDTLEVEVDVAEANVARLQPQHPADVIVEAFPERKYKGVLRQVIPTADRTRATVMVKVTILDKDTNLKPEMSAKVTFVEPAQAPATAASERVVVVPQSAVVTRDGASHVFTVVGNVVESKAVTVGPRREDGVVISEGLDGSEVIVAEPPDSLEAGDRVKVSAAAQAPGPQASTGGSQTAASR